MEKFNLQDFAGGAVSEQISAAMQRIYENIADPNTLPEKARKLTVELTFKPNKSDRTDVDVFAVVKTSLQPRAAIESRMIVEGDGLGNVRAAEWSKSAMKGQLEFEEAAGDTAGDKYKTEAQRADSGGVIDLQKQRVTM